MELITNMKGSMSTVHINPKVGPASESKFMSF